MKIKLKQLDYRYYIGIVLIALAIVFGLIFILRAPKSAEAEWFNDGWYYRQSISLTNSSSAVTNIRVKILDGEDLSSLVSAGKIQADLDDLRFTDINGNILEYWIEDDTNSSVDIWAFLPSVSADGVTIYMYYGNVSVDAGSDSSALPSSCSEINSFLGSGIYYIDEDGLGSNDPFQVYCDMSTEGGGWTQIINLDTNDGVDHWWGDTTYWQGTGTEGSTATSLTAGYKSQTFVDMDGFAEMMFFLHTEGTEVAYGVYDLLESYQASSFYDLLNTADSDAGTTITGTLQHQSGASGSPLNTERGQTRYGDEFVDSFNTEAVVVNRVKRFNTDGINYMRLATTFDNSTYSHTFSGLGVHHERPTGSYITKLEAAPVTAYCGIVPRYGSDATSTGGFCGTVTSYDRDMAIFVREFIPTNTNVAIASPSSEEKGPGPVAYWSFNEGYGTTANDRTSNSNDGTLQNGPDWLSEEFCPVGKCIDFSDDYDAGVNIIDENYVGLTDYTMSAWINIKGTHEHYTGAIMSSGNWNSDEWVFGIDQNNTEIDLYQAGSKSYDFELNKWTYVVVTRNGSLYTFYVNGQDIGGYTGSSAALVSSDSNTMIGRETYASGYFNFNGWIDEPKIYDYVRTEVQILTDYNAGLAGVSSASGISVAMGGQSQKSLSDGLVGYWKMDEIASPSVDSSGNGNSGTWAGTADDAAGKFGNAIDLDGDSDSVNMGDVLDLNTSDLTVGAWVYANNTNRSGIVGKGMYLYDSQNRPGYGLMLNGSLHFHIREDSLDGNRLTYDFSDYVNKWVYVTGIRSAHGSGQKMDLYINGNLVNSMTTDHLDNVDTGHSLILGYSTYPAYFNGSIDEVRVYNRALSSREVKQLYEYAPGPVAYWNFEEKQGTTLYDKSGNGNDGTLTTMDENTDWVLGKYGSALDFDGDNDYVNVADDTTLKPAIITVEAWIRIADDTARRQLFLTKWNGYSCETDTSHRPFFRVTNGSDSPMGDALTIGEWYHFAGVYDPSAGALHQGNSLYINGEYLGTTADSDAIAHSTNILTIGKYAGGYPWGGNIDEVKIYNYARTQKQILEDMNGGRPASKSPVGYWKFDEGYGTTTNDEDLGGNDGTISGATWTNDGKINKALSFDGDDDYVTHSDIPFDKDESWSFSMWQYKPTGSATTWQGFIGNTNGSNGGYWMWHPNLTWYQEYYDPGTGYEYYGYQNSNINLGDEIPYDEWFNLTVTYNGDDYNTKIYVNGKFLESDISTWSPSPVTQLVFKWIGLGGSSRNFEGKIDETKIFNYALTEDEVRQEYNQGKAIVIGSEKNTSSTWNDGGFGGDAPIAHWNFEEGSGITANDISANDNTGTLTNMESNDWVLGKESSWALDFDGSDEYIAISSPSVGANDLTVSFWMKPDNLSSETILGTISTYTVLVQVQDNNTIEFNLGEGGVHNYYDITSTFQTNQWQYVTITKVASGAVKIYLNGEDVTSGSPTISNAVNIAWNLIGSEKLGAGLYFEGQLDEVKIFDYARTPAQIAFDYNGGKPIGHWLLNDGEGITANDSSGNNNDGTLTTMDPATDLGDIDATDGADQLSISAWVYSSDFTQNGMIIMKNTVNAVWELYLEGAVKWRGGGTSGTLTVTSPSDNNWHHIVVVQNGTTATMYIDGQEKDSETVSAIGSSAGSINIGRYDSSYYFSGKIDDVQIYNYALSADQIKEVYNGGAMRFK
jgi:concanavalin A-like lectin/glucanase superfamily protein/uncharacterized protein DUF2341/fibrinogen beta/gamma subunit family protein